MKKLSSFCSARVSQHSYALLALACLIVGVALSFFVRFLSMPYTGLVDNYPETYYEDGHLIFSPRALFSPAVTAGLLPERDKILAIEGKPLGSTRDLIDIVYAVDGYTPLTLTILRDNSQRLSLKLVPQPTLWRFDWLFMLVFALCLVYTIYYLLRYYPRQRAYLFVTLACLGYLLVVCVKPFFYENVFTISLIHLGVFAPWLLVFFALSFPRPKLPAPFLSSLIIIISLAYLGFAVVRVYLIHMWVQSHAEIWWERYRTLGRYNNGANFIAYLTFLCLMGGTYFRSAARRERALAGWFVLGFIISIIMYTCVEQIPIMLKSSPASRMGSANLGILFLIPLPLFFLVGLKGGERINFKAVRTGVVLHLLLFLFILFFFLRLFPPLQKYFMDNNGLPVELAAYSAMVILFILLFPLYNGLRYLLGKLFLFKKSGAFGQREEYLAYLEHRLQQLETDCQGQSLRTSRERQQEKLLELRAFTTAFSRQLQSLGPRVRQAVSCLKKTTSPAGTRTVPAPDIQSVAGELNQVFSRLKKEQQVLKEYFLLHTALLHQCDLLFLLKKTITQVSAEFPAIKIECALGPLPPRDCSPEEVLFALRQVLRNSCEATPLHAAGPRVSATPTPEGSLIEIADSGPGIPLLKQKQLFTPFFTTKEGHLGLGLYYAKLYLLKNEGRITFAGSRERGALFRIHL